MEPIRNFLRHKATSVKYYEAECTRIDHDNSLIHISDRFETKDTASTTKVPFDYLVVGVGAENATFGIPGVREYGSFLKEVGDARTKRKRIMDCVETATFKGQSLDEIKRLLRMVVVGGGPTGVEFAAELQGFFESDIREWIPEVREHFRITLIEAMPAVLPMFSKKLVNYTEQTFMEASIDIRTKTTVKEVGPTHIRTETSDTRDAKSMEDIPYGLLVWATSNAVRPVVRDLMNQLPAQAESRRGLAVDQHLAVRDAKNIWAVGDCASANYAPTAQVASQQGAFLAESFNSQAKADEIATQLTALSESRYRSDDQERTKIATDIKDLHRRLRRLAQSTPFGCFHQGSLAYIGSEKAIAEITWLAGNNIAVGGPLTYFFWRSVYLNMCFSTRNRLLVLGDWIKSYVFGRDVSRE